LDCCEVLFKKGKFSTDSCKNDVRGKFLHQPTCWKYMSSTSGGATVVSKSCQCQSCIARNADALSDVHILIVVTFELFELYYWLELYELYYR